MVHSSDNETALYQELDYLQVKEMVCVRIIPLTMNLFFFVRFWLLVEIVHHQWRGSAITPCSTEICCRVGRG